jgi:Mn2+/Fe2+ NRAMP family transporter
MVIAISRLRPGEIIAGAGAVLLLVLMFAVPWYGVKSTLTPTASTLGVSTSLDGWDSLSDLRWLLIVTIVAALALAYFQATRRAPAIPVSLSVIVTVLGLVSALALIYRVLINVPGSDSVVDARVGAYLGLASTLAILYGGYASMRQEGISPDDAPAEIETIRRGEPGGS